MRGPVWRAPSRALPSCHKSRAFSPSAPHARRVQDRADQHRQRHRPDHAEPFLVGSRIRHLDFERFAHHTTPSTAVYIPVIAIIGAREIGAKCGVCAPISSKVLRCSFLDTDSSTSASMLAFTLVLRLHI